MEQNYSDIIEENLDRYPSKIGMRKSAADSFREEPTNPDSRGAKSNPYHHSTRQRMAHRESRLAKLTFE
jgi:hypothetical protein